MQISLSVLFPSGALELSAIFSGNLVRRIYAGYSRREARAHFRQWAGKL